MENYLSALKKHPLCFRTEHTSDRIIPAEISNEKLVELVNLQILTAAISARIVQVSSEDLNSEILHALKEVFVLLGVDRGGLLEVSENSLVVKISHAWYDEGVDEVSREINHVDLFPWAFEKIIVRGETLVLVNLEDLPEQANVDRQSYEFFRIKSALTIPLFIGSRVHHLFVVNSLKRERDWPSGIISSLRLLGEIFVSALHRSEAEQELQRTKERLDMAADSAGAGLWELNLDHGYFWVTVKSLELFGFEPGTKLHFSRFLETVHGDDHKRIAEAIEIVCRTRKEMSVEYRVPGPKGQMRWMMSQGRLLDGRNGEPQRIMGVTLDITPRKLMEQRLQEQFQEIQKLRERLEQENTYLRQEVSLDRERHGFLSDSDCMRAVISHVEQVAGTDSTVLVQGETGTGKELVAQSIHRLSKRGSHLMVKVNCAALPSALVESELFGREKGAFTGALNRQVGRFELAHGSTLFLDEISEMPLETQAKLLRVLQEGEFERLGSARTIKVDVRIIAATNRNLLEEVGKGHFRRDLFYRLNVFPIHIPPLREHPEDVPQLVWGFVNEFGQRMGKKISRIAGRDMEWLKAYSWPGNIRELRNVIEHAMIVSKGDTLELQQPSNVLPQQTSPVTLEEMERQHILATLKTTQGRIKGRGGAAERLGIKPSTLYSRMRKLGVNFLRN
ncbi:MAG: sigma 54-interacting transcriptional regulator [Deltaproteobacteria bacterium]|nr:sigma 54-interacting transcriptional regulator [Deltaproteobacteria bacterium]